LHGGSLKDEDDSAVQEPDRLQLGRRAAAATWRTNGGSSSLETSGGGMQQLGDERRRQARVSSERPTLIPKTIAAAACTHPDECGGGPHRSEEVEMSAGRAYMKPRIENHVHKKNHSPPVLLKVGKTGKTKPVGFQYKIQFLKI
jgi:hypothetical protein